MKRLLLILAAATTLSASAVTTADLQGTTFTVDTLKHFTIGPGVTHSVLRYSTSGRYFDAYVIDMDRNAEGADRVRPKIEIGGDSARIGEAITSMARRKTNAEAQYIAAINGDFFITSAFANQLPWGTQVLGYPNMACAVNSQLAAPDVIDIGSRENALVIGADSRDMWIDATDITYRVCNNDGTVSAYANALNFPRQDEWMIIYNPYNGKYTRTPDNGRELVLRLVSEKVSTMNKSTKYVVTEDWREGGNSRIPDDGLVISVGPNYTGEGLDWLNDLKKGDNLKVKLGIKLPAFSIKPEIAEICGGDVRILKENVTTTEAIRWINTPSAQYSRSLVGYSQDRGHFVMCSIDRVGGSSGVTYYEAADVMRSLGCWDALDLDGGGSTALWTPTHGFLNVLRDGSERAVANGIFVRMDAPEDNNIAALRFVDWAITLPRYGEYRPVIYGYNQYGRLIDTDVKGFTLSAPQELGTVSADGAALIASGAGTHALTASLGDISCSIPVTIDANGTARPRLDKVLLDNKTPWTIELQAQVKTTLMNVSPVAFDWTSSDPAVATVDANGLVTPVANGVTVISGRTPGATEGPEVTVTVENSPTPTLPVAGTTFVPTEWKTTVTSVKNPVLTANGSGFDATFSVSSTRGPRLTVAKDVVLYSRPDAIELTFNPKDNTYKSITLNIHPANSARPLSHELTGPFTANTDNKVVIRLADINGIDLTDIGAYPMTFKSIAVVPGGKTGAYAFSVPALDAHYDNYSAVGNIVADSDFDGNAPLRVTVSGATLSLPFAADAVTVTDLSGRTVAAATATDRVDVSAAPGVYIVTALRQGRAFAAKVILR